MTILQAVPGVWEHLADNGLTLLILGVACYVLYNRDKVMNEKMDRYISEDRTKMIDVISANTKAFEMLKDTLEELKRTEEDIGRSLGK